MTSRYIDVSQLAANPQNLGIHNRQSTATETRHNKRHKKESKGTPIEEQQTASSNAKWLLISWMPRLDINPNTNIPNKI
jgi:hypothetical protein